MIFNDNAVEFSWDGRDYLWILSRVTWDAALQDANSRNGTLWSSETSEENLGILSALEEKISGGVSTAFLGSQQDGVNYVWLGLNDKDISGTWTWDSTENLSYTNWSSTATPTNNTVDTVAAFAVVIPDDVSSIAKGEWNDFSETDLNTYIVEQAQSTPVIIEFNTTSSNGLESVASKDITVDLSAASSSDVTIDYIVTGTATGSGTDYTISNGTLTIAAGQTSGVITIADIVDDALIEPDETVIVTLSNPTNATLESDIKTIVGNNYAFAALKEDGSVVTWGSYDKGGDSSSVDLSSGVSSIVGNGTAFAAIKEDGSVVTWGRNDYGGDSSSVADSLTNVSSIVGTGFTFAAIKEDGSVVTWGEPGYGGDSSSVDLSSGVSSIVGNGTAFAAIKTDGSVVTWGSSTSGGDSSSVDLTSGVSSIVSAGQAFAALKSDGSVVTWGQHHYLPNSSAVASNLTSDVRSIISNSAAFAAIKTDGSVVTWGYSTHSNSGGDSTGVDFSGGVSSIVSTTHAFAALKEDGSVVTWGSSITGGDSSSVDSSLSNGVISIVGNGKAFAAIKEDGSVVTWGGADWDVDISSVQTDSISGVISIFSNGAAYAAIKEDGSVVTWGRDDQGGDSSAVQSDLTAKTSHTYTIENNDVLNEEEPSFDATVQTDSSHYLDDVTLHYVNSSDEDIGISSVVQNGEIEIDQSVGFDVVTLSDSTAHESGIQTNDATAILKHIVGLITLDEYAGLNAADVNNNGSIQTNDATAILKHIVGLDTINNFDLVNNTTGQRVTQLEDNPTTVPALTIVENGDVNQSGAFNNDYLVSIEIT